MNKQLFYLGIILFTTVMLSSCRIQAPTYKAIQNVKVERVGTTGVKLGGEAVFNNPNCVRFKITDLALDVLLDKRLVGTLGEKADILIKRKSDFTIPFGLTLKPEGTIFDNLKTILNLFNDKSTEMAIVGKVKVKWLFIKKEIPIQYKQSFKLSDIKQGR